MNDLPEDLLRRLERATAPAGRFDDPPVEAPIVPSPPVGDAAEEIELRAAWLELGRRLEASDRAVESAGRELFAGEGSAAPLDATIEPATAADRVRPAGRRLRPWLALVEAVAAAALLLAVTHWSRPTDSESPFGLVAERGGTGEVPGATAESPAAPQIATSDAGQGGAMRENPAGDSPVETSVDEAAWDDAFDEQLAATQQRLAQLFTTGTSNETRVQSLRDAMEQFGADLDANSL